MKFWLSLIVSVVLVTAVVNWIRMNHGAQTVAMPDRAAVKADELPKIVFDGLKRDGKTFPLPGVGHVFNLEAGETVINTTKSVEILFHNEGKGPLEIKLVSTSCGCLHTVEVDGQKLVPINQEGQQSATVQPSKEGILKLSWSPTEENASGGPSGPRVRIRIVLLTNDPQFRDTLELELTSPLIRAPKERKS
jgi:hypothetical protein